MNNTPIIILGMHRSGTSLLSRILEETGIFMGHKKDDNNEALFFLKFNDWILKQANATWDNPYNYTLADEEFKDLIVKIAKKHIKSLRRIEYSGFKKGLKYRRLEDIDFPWGWKDPRNSFTLDIWLKVFPSAKIVHIYRNPIDVANSLRNRVLKTRKKFKWSFKKEIKLFFTRGFLEYGDSIRVLYLEEGVKLWKEYITRVLTLEKTLNLDFIHIKYEDFLEKPEFILKELYRKLGIEINDDKLEKIIKNINPNRKYAFINNENLIELYNSVKNDELIKKLGYGDLV